ncbi:uncharacterized protein [Mobula birostris]|uniref:uncharacterized protein isoform X2 n=1 Tax=Mobula birostris TaxID=1983395 RepID=UPI003B28011C
MDESETYMNFAKTNSGILRKASRDILSSTNSELKTGKEEPLSNKEQDPAVASGRGELPITAQTGMNSTYSVLNLRKDEPLIHEYEDLPIASGPAELSVTPQADGLTSTYALLDLRNDENHIDEYEDPPIARGPAELSVTAEADAHKQEPSENIGNRWHCKICPLCLTMFVLVAIVVGLSIYVLQLRQSLITGDRNYRRLWEQYQEMNRTQVQYQLKVHELNSTLESRISEYPRISILEKNITVLNSDLSALNREHTNLRHQFNHIDMKYRTITESQAQICQYLTRRREQTCSQHWMRTEDRCYFISTLETSYDEAKEGCSNFDGRLLEINSKREEDFVSISIGHAGRTYWIGKCRDGNVTSYLLYEKLYGQSKCRTCNSYFWSYDCSSKYRFICEKSAHLYPDIHEEIQGLCQHPVGPTSIM